MLRTINYKSDNLNWRHPADDNRYNITSCDDTSLYKINCDSVKKYKRVRTSLGVACCRLNNDMPEILLVCKRYTYAYSDFVHGKYVTGNNKDLMKLFNMMTITEKHIILSLNFSHMWYYIWLNAKTQSMHYLTAKQKFESVFGGKDGLTKLQSLISKSTHTRLIWEIPKGHKLNKSETNINCAIREFQEETGINKTKYKIIPSAIQQYSYINDGTLYNNIYYIAYSKHNIEPKIDFTLTKQVEEISDIRWMNIDDISKNLDTKKLENQIRPIFDYVKKYIKI